MTPLHIHINPLIEEVIFIPSPRRKKRSAVQVNCWKSIDSIDSNEQFICTKTLTMALLDIKSRHTLIKHCRHLGYKSRTHTQEEIAQLFLLTRWLKAGYGAHSRAQFMKLKRQQKLREAFFTLGINIDKELAQLHRKIQKSYEQTILTAS